MKSKLVLVLVGALVLSFLPGCRDFTMEEYYEAKAERTEAREIIAELEAQLKVEEATVAGLRRELETSQARNAELELELEAHQARITELVAQLAICQTNPPVTEETPPIPIQEKTFMYRGFEYKLTTVEVAMVEATWDGDKFTTSWELTNTSRRKIHLDLLAVKAYDQMELKGERRKTDDEDNDNGEVEYTEAAIVLYPDLQDDIEMAWPGQTVKFNTEWIFGPRSEVITVEFFVVREDDPPEHLQDELIPFFTITRP